jgi:ribonuclease Z
MIKVKILFSSSAIATQILISNLNNDILVDVGDGTLRDLTAKKYNFSRLRGILITHEHMDHYSGLPSLIHFINLLNSTRNLVIIAPKPIKRLTKLIGFPPLYRKLNFQIKLHEVIPRRKIKLSTFNILPFKVDHVEAPSLGYCITDKDGYKVVISGDTRKCKALIDQVNNADLAVIESTYENKFSENAKLHGHMIRSDAKKIGSKARKSIFIHKTNMYYYNKMKCR